MNSSTLSLLIPAYNAERFLPRLLASARAQTVPFDEIWVYDDCSTDDTANVARALGANVISGEVNRGCSAGKNALASKAGTGWLHFHDADDELLPQFSATARKWIERDEHDVVLFAYARRDDATNEDLGNVVFDKTALETDARAYAIRQIINPFCGLYRRQTFIECGGYDEDPQVLYNEDAAFHIRLAFAGLRFSSDDEVSVVNYRVSQSMSSSNMKKCAISQYHVMRKTLERDGSHRYSREISERLWGLSGLLGSLDAWSEAEQAALLASRLHPPSASSGSVWFRALASINPGIALRVRESAIRMLKPQMRSRSAGV